MFWPISLVTNAYAKRKLWQDAMVLDICSPMNKFNFVFSDSRISCYGTDSPLKIQNPFSNNKNQEKTSHLERFTDY